MTQYSIESRTWKCVKWYGFLSFVRKYIKYLLGTGLDALKAASKKVVHKAAEATGEFIGNKKIADNIVKPKQLYILSYSAKKEKKKKIKNKKEKILNDLRQVL